MNKIAFINILTGEATRQNGKRLISNKQAAELARKAGINAKGEVEREHKACERRFEKLVSR